MAERQALIERQARLERLLKDFRQRVAHIPGIIEVGIGLKQVGGQWTDQISFQVFVRRKVATSAVPAGQMIPREFEGIPVDVIEVTTGSSTSDSSEHRPLVGGIKIVTSKSSLFGTLGCIARRTTPEAEAVILSNHHVLALGGAAAGDKVGQPSYTESCCCTCGEVGEILPGGSRGGLVDCAIAKIKSGIGWEAQIRTIGTVTGVNTAVVGETVRKVGASSDLTTGTVASISLPIIIDGITFSSQIAVNPSSGAFQIGGDSGAALVNAAGEVVGLMHGRFPGATGLNGVASPIAAVLSTLSITIPTSGGGTASAGAVLAEDYSMTEVEKALQSIESELRRTETGRGILALTQTHREEVFRLVNHERAVQVAWRRNQGPALIAAFLRENARRSTPIPKELNGIPIMNLLIAMSAALQVYGSSQLRHDLDRYSFQVMRLTDQCDTLGELYEMLDALEYEGAAASR